MQETEQLEEVYLMSAQDEIHKLNNNLGVYGEQIKTCVGEIGKHTKKIEKLLEGQGEINGRLSLGAQRFKDMKEDIEDLKENKVSVNVLKAYCIGAIGAGSLIGWCLAMATKFLSQ